MMDLLERFMKQELQKIDQTDFRFKKVMKKKMGKLYIKSKDYDN